MKRIIQATQSDELIVNKSKFTGYALIGESREDFLSSINTIASQMPGSNHVAFAYQIKTNHGVDAYFNDAGESSGTAGKPLLNILEKKNIVNCGLAVVRFYGGVNLGTGGLARAYTRSGMLALDKAKIEPFIEHIKYKLSFKYNQLGKIYNVINSSNGIIMDKHFDQNITLLAKLTENTFQEITKHFPTIIIKRLD